MQEEHRDGLVSKPEEYTPQKMHLSIKDYMVKQVKVFRENSEAHKEALKSYSQMTANQKRRMRRRLLKRK